MNPRFPTTYYKCTCGVVYEAITAYSKVCYVGFAPPTFGKLVTRKPDPRFTCKYCGNNYWDNPKQLADRRMT